GTTADVDFHIRYGNGPAPVVPDMAPGGAVLQQGKWRVSRATACFLDAKIGDPCAPHEFLTPEQQAIGKPFADLARADLSDDDRIAEIEHGRDMSEFILR